MPGFQPYPRPYEIMVLISPDFTDEALDEAVDSVARLIGEHGGSVTNIKRDTPWGRRRLIYPIQRFRDATYVLYNFTSSPSSIVGFERDLKLDERVIRYLVVRDESKPAPEEEDEGAEDAEAGETAAAGTPESEQAVVAAPAEAEEAAPIDAETAAVVEGGDEAQPGAAEEPAEAVADAETENALEQEQETEPEPSEPSGQGEQQ